MKKIQFLSLLILIALSSACRNYQFGIINGKSKDERKRLFSRDTIHSQKTQIAAISNHPDFLIGGQIAGIYNISTKKINGIQLAGIANKADSIQGLQFSLLVNKANFMKGAQITSLVNSAKYINGVQISTFINKAGSLHGMQLAGFINKADSVKGSQLAGFINVAGEAEGMQLSFMNFSKENKGIPIGFFSYVQYGYHKIELGLDDQSFTTFAFRTGVDKFHNIFLTGKTFDNRNYWTFGYGLGSALAISKNKKWYLDLDLTVQTVQPSTIQMFKQANMWNKFFLGLEYRPIKKINLIIGPTVNMSISESKNFDFKKNTPSNFYKFKNSDVNLNMWIGGRVAIHFL